MPHLLRSTTPLNTTSWPSKPSHDFRSQDCTRVPEAAHDLGPLRRQVSEIVDSILSDTTPEDAPVREKLRWHLANNPGQPEKALLGHLLAVSAEQEAN